MIHTVFPRPLTSTMTDAQIALVAFYSPARAEEHLVHGWIAMGKALRADTRAEEKGHLAYAANRLACAKSEPVSRGVSAATRAAYEAEVASLAAAIADFV